MKGSCLVHRHCNLCYCTVCAGQYVASGYLQINNRYSVYVRTTFWHGCRHITASWFRNWGVWFVYIARKMKACSLYFRCLSHGRKRWVKKPAIPKKGEAKIVTYKGTGVIKAILCYIYITDRWYLRCNKLGGPIWQRTVCRSQWLTVVHSILKLLNVF